MGNPIRGAFYGILIASPIWFGLFLLSWASRIVWLQYLLMPFVLICSLAVCVFALIKINDLKNFVLDRCFED